MFYHCLQVRERNKWDIQEKMANSTIEYLNLNIYVFDCYNNVGKYDEYINLLIDIFQSWVYQLILVPWTKSEPGIIFLYSRRPHIMY